MPLEDERHRMESLLLQIVQEEQQQMLRLGFIEAFIPNVESPVRCNIFLSANWHICERLLLVIASGNGIQPGIWSRSLVLESDITPNQYRSGSMLPYLHTALSAGFGVIVLNPSTNSVYLNKEKVLIPNSENPEEHVRYVWETFGTRSACSQVYIAAYGRGGILAKHLIDTQPNLCIKTAAIAFIESSHQIEKSDPEEVRTLLKSRGINWQRSKHAAGTQLGTTLQLGCLSLSAGEPDGKKVTSSNTAWTIAASMDTVFAFFESARNFVAETESKSEMDQIPHFEAVFEAHEEDAEMIAFHDDLEEESKSEGARRSSRARSMVISTSMSVSDFEMLAVVGKGAYGKVYLARKKLGRNAGRFYAMKVSRKEDVLEKKQVEHAKLEQRILKAIEHPFIVRLRYAFQNEHKLYLLMDYYCGGSLYTQLRKRERFDIAQARFYAAELALALTHLHDMRIMYRDLKLENILMDSEGHIAITDFGLSKDDEKGSTFVGTAEYLAPELLCSQRTSTSYGKSVDWWGYGVLVYEMIRGQTPFWDSNRRQMFKKILLKEPEFPSDLFSDVVVDFLKQLLIKNPRGRLGCRDPLGGPAELFSHPWFHGIDWQEMLDRKLEPPVRPVAFHDQAVSNVPAMPESPTSCGKLSSNGSMHFEGYSYRGSDVLTGSRAPSYITDSDLRMDLGECAVDFTNQTG
uniref:Ribosomal protein S6 kinase putative n=1 Tax=Albugo laibachii Nc14 TaxID=890382 RepID=F0W616_9STRA|nr:ribosomal protein S6 kinase putative [Albugo laibachii Nc14]|eukprot:CCA16558.1 ribosomal protein S6 kinase putative [Albugo laibachii Nc14]